MLTYLTINLFKSPAQTLVNTVNTVGVMGKGIALVFKQLYPEMYQQYRALCQAGQLDIGKLHIYRTPNKIIINFPTKKHWRSRSRVEYIEVGLKEFVNSYSKYGISSVSFPQLGCGNGELDWEQQVQPVMERYLKDLPIPVYIHLYPKSPDFVPERLDAEYARQIQMERQALSFDQVWQDLQSLILEHPQQLSLFTSNLNQPEPDKVSSASSKSLLKEQEFNRLGPKPDQTVEIEIMEDRILFKPDSNKVVVVYRQDLADLWNTLRLNGTLHKRNVPEPIRADGATELVFDLLARLPYIQRINLQLSKQVTPSQGLQYMPPPQTEPNKIMEIVV
jgi:O-acetyl-ADP-ribose deacetylase (regulator of RNase III)